MKHKPWCCMPDRWQTHMNRTPYRTNCFDNRNVLHTPACVLSGAACRTHTCATSRSKHTHLLQLAHSGCMHTRAKTYECVCFDSRYAPLPVCTCAVGCRWQNPKCVISHSKMHKWKETAHSGAHSWHIQGTFEHIRTNSDKCAHLVGPECPSKNRSDDDTPRAEVAHSAEPPRPFIILKGGSVVREVKGNRCSDPFLEIYRQLSVPQQAIRSKFGHHQLCMGR